MPNGRSAAEAAVAAGEQEVARQHADYREQTKGRPTPSQHECNLIKVGAPPDQKEGDNAGNTKAELFGVRTRQVSAGRGGEYVTRQAQPQPRPAAPPRQPAPPRPPAE